MNENEVKKYVQFYKTKLGREILKYETQFVGEKISGYKNILSIGCGPALLESELQKQHPSIHIIGLDTSKEMIKQAPKRISVVHGDAQELKFKDNSFDAVVYITSLEFIHDIQKTIQESFRILAAQGLLLILMLNPKSSYFREKYSKKDSFIYKYIKHTDINRIKDIVSQYFCVRNHQYFLGLKNHKIIDTCNPNTACLYVIECEKR